MNFSRYVTDEVVLEVESMLWLLTLACFSTRCSDWPPQLSVAGRGPVSASAEKIQGLIVITPNHSRKTLLV